MRFTVEPWSAEYGPSSEAAMLEAAQPPKLDVELDPSKWAAITPVSDGRTDVVFIDGVRRVDANVWIEQPGDLPVLGLCAVYAAGAVRANGTAEVVAVEAARGLFTSALGASDLETKHGSYRVHPSAGESPEDLWLAIQSEMGKLEGEIARTFGEESLVVVDGPLSHGRHPNGVVGYIKRQHTHYLPPEVRPVLLNLPVARRTPIFLIGGRSNRYSWYQRLAVGGGPAGGLVRCEVAADSPIDEAIRLADTVASLLPRFASHPHKDPRAPQNLYPIAGLERTLRGRLGDPSLMERAIRLASAGR
jgi:hypothetical protein